MAPVEAKTRTSFDMEEIRVGLSWSLCPSASSSGRNRESPGTLLARLHDATVVPRQRGVTLEQIIEQVEEVSKVPQLVNIRREV